MTGNLEFRKTITIAAGKEEVWNALVDPALVSRYHLAPLFLIELEQIN